MNGTTDILDVLTFIERMTAMSDCQLVQIREEVDEKISLHYDFVNPFSGSERCL